MNLAREIKKDIYWIGVNDRRTHIFENYWPIPKGVAYNSYIIVDEKVVVIDTIERSKMDDYVENIEQLLNGRKVDYLVINHMEPDHTGAIKALLCHYPDVYCQCFLSRYPDVCRQCFLFRCPPFFSSLLHLILRAFLHFYFPEYSW